MVLTPILILPLLLSLTRYFPVEGGVMPKYGKERVIHINQRGLTPRNIKEKVKHMVNTTVSNNITTVVTTQYVDDGAQSYEEQVNNSLSILLFNVFPRTSNN